jgi:hypothetical protein
LKAKEGPRIVQKETLRDLHKIELLLKEAVAVTETVGLDVLLEILKEALLECEMQIDQASGRPQPEH